MSSDLGSHDAVPRKEMNNTTPIPKENPQSDVSELRGDEMSTPGNPHASDTSDEDLWALVRQYKALKTRKQELLADGQEDEEGRCAALRVMCGQATTKQTSGVTEPSRPSW